MRVNVLTLFALFAGLFYSGVARAESIIKNDSGHLKYAFELELHGLLGYFRPPGDGGGLGLGAGLSVTIPLAEEGFIPNVNDSVGLGFGLDWLHYGGGGPAYGSCAEYQGTGADRICIRVEGAGGPSQYFFAPIVMQWNFFLTPEWSVFGEPGLGLYLQNRDLDGSSTLGLMPIFQAGGRYHFKERISLTFRALYPTTSVGVSFFF